MKKKSWLDYPLSADWWMLIIAVILIIAVFSCMKLGAV